MKKRHSLIKVSGGACLALFSLIAVSCSEGADCDERFNGKGVTNAQLENPVAEDIKFSTVVNSDGSESVLCEWPIVYGAGGFETEVFNVDDPVNPVIVSEKDTIDGNSFTFKKAEDTKYQVNIRVIDNVAYNNKGAAEAVLISYSSMVPAQVIPAGSNIAEFVRTHIVDTQDEQAFELEAGATYELTEDVDFGKYQVQLRGDKIHHPTIVYGGEVALKCSNGLKVKFINFDCTNAEKTYGAIMCSDDEPTEDWGIICNGKNGWQMDNPIMITDCWFKNVKNGVFNVGKNAWAIKDFRMENCIVQMACDGSKFGNGAIICGFGDTYFQGEQKWSGLVANITVKECTVYNTLDNSKTRFIRNASNAVRRMFATDDAVCTLENNTFVRTMNKKEFANNTTNSALFVINFNNNICFDVFRLQKFIQGNCTGNVDMTTNTAWGVANKIDATDLQRIVTEEDPGFQYGDCTNLPELDLTKPNGGVDFTATGAIASKIGDPRWRK